MKRPITVLLLLPILLIGACAPAGEESTEEDVDSLQDAATEEFQDFQVAMQEALAGIDEGIDSLETLAESADEELEAEMSSTIAQLREERDALQQDLRQLGTAGEANLEDLRAELQQQLEELDAKVDAAINPFDDSDPAADTT